MNKVLKVLKAKLDLKAYKDLKVLQENRAHKASLALMEQMVLKDLKAYKEKQGQ